MLRLNEISPAPGARKSRQRVGRGIGSGRGKTCGRGHKGQKARAGGSPKRGFEGGQMPLHRRLPKVGFPSRTAGQKAEIRLHELTKIGDDVIDLSALRRADIIGHKIKRAKVIASGEISKAVCLRGIAVTKGARAAIEAAGGKIED